MEVFPFVHREPVRFGDLDAMGHVNNAVYLTYIESARIAFLLDLGLVRGLDELGIVEIDFRSPVRFGETVEIGVRAAGFGRKSFELEYRLEVESRLAAEARSVCASYDYAKHEATTIPDTWRERLVA